MDCETSWLACWCASLKITVGFGSCDCVKREGVSFDDLYRARGRESDVIRGAVHLRDKPVTGTKLVRKKMGAKSKLHYYYTLVRVIIISTSTYYLLVIVVV